jgi:hypothetical protein
LDVGDMNQDGCDDIVIGYGSSGVRCYIFDKAQGDWDLASTGLPTSGSYHPQFGDVDGDGFLDIVAYDAPTGQVYLGDGSGSWVLDGSFTLPSNGGYSAFTVDGDFDHDGREDIVIQAEQGSWPSYQNYLHAFSPWEEPSSLSALVQKPLGGETYRSGSIRDIRWLSGVPTSQGESSVEIQVSLNGASGPWDTIVFGLPNTGRYEWLVDAGGSDNSRIKVIVSTASSNSSAVSFADFTILGFTVDAGGPYYAAPEQAIQFSGLAENGNPPYIYQWDFGDGNSSFEQNPTHTYPVNGNYTVVLSVTDADDVTIRDTTWALVFGNGPPSTPVIDGPLQGRPGVDYTFSFVSIDPNGDDLSYTIDWGDGDTEVIGPYPSGVVAYANHTWDAKGTYNLKAKASDPYLWESEWGMFSFAVPKLYVFHVISLHRWSKLAAYLDLF